MATDAFTIPWAAEYKWREPPNLPTEFEGLANIAAITREVWNSEALERQLAYRSPLFSPSCAVCGADFQEPFGRQGWECTTCHSLHFPDVTYGGSHGHHKVVNPRTGEVVAEWNDVVEHPDRWADPSRHWRAVEADRPRREAQARRERRRRRVLTLIGRILPSPPTGAS